MQPEYHALPCIQACQTRADGKADGAAKRADKRTSLELRKVCRAATRAYMGSESPRRYSCTRELQMSSLACSTSATRQPSCLTGEFFVSVQMCVASLQSATGSKCARQFCVQWPEAGSTAMPHVRFSTTTQQ